MSSCPRCGTSLQAPAPICTACCQPLIDLDRETIPGRIDLVALEAGEIAMPDIAPPPPVVPQPTPQPAVDYHPRLASAGAGNGLGLTTNRAAGFNPQRISTAPLPPNRFREADRRMQARVQGGAQPSQDAPPPLRVAPSTKWVEPEDE